MLRLRAARSAAAQSAIGDGESDRCTNLTRVPSAWLRPLPGAYLGERTSSNPLQGQPEIAWFKGWEATQFPQLQLTALGALSRDLLKEMPCA